MSNIKNNKIDAYLREYILSDTGEHNYYLSLSYNGVSFAELYKGENTEAREFANNFKWYYLNSNPYADKHTFTDVHGQPSNKRSASSILSSIKGIEEIEDSIDNLVRTSVNLGIQSDLTVHIDEIEYPIVKDTDNKFYFPSDRLKVSRKGYNADILNELKKDVKEIRVTSSKRKALPKQKMISM